MNELTIDNRTYYYNARNEYNLTLIYDSIPERIISLPGILTENEVIIAIKAYENGFSRGNTFGANRIRRNFNELLKSE